MMDPHFKAMLEEQARAAPAETPPLHMVPRDFLRGMYREQRKSQNLKTSPSDVKAGDLQVGGGEGPIPARLYTPAGAATLGPLLVYFHGGGWVIGDLETHDAHCRRLAAFSGARVLAVDYRLAPENPFPASSTPCRGDPLGLRPRGRDRRGHGADRRRRRFRRRQPGGLRRPGPARGFAAAPEVPAPALSGDRT